MQGTNALTYAMTVGLAGLWACGGPADYTSQEDSIVGGTVDEGHPAVVFIRSKDLLSGGISICTGTLIDPQVVLTAAHCIKPPGRSFLINFEIALGTERDPLANQGWLPVADQIVHPRWNPNAPPENGNDIGVLVLNNPIDNVPPMDINRAALTRNMIGQAVVAVGWGTVDRNDFGSAGLKRKVDVALNSFNDKLIRTGRAGANTCGGDSGGPHLMNIGGQELIVGVTSFGPSQCDLGESNQTRVDTFASWVDDQLAAHGAAPTAPPTNPPPTNPPPTNRPPVEPPRGLLGVEITSPSAGDRFDVGEEVLFSATATDGNGEDVSNLIVWSSNIDGTLGQGAQISATLSEGNHSISAKLELGNSQAITSINVTVGANAGAGGNGIPPEVCARFPFLCD